MVSMARAAIHEMTCLAILIRGSTKYSHSLFSLCESRSNVVLVDMFGQLVQFLKGATCSNLDQDGNSMQRTKSRASFLSLTVCFLGLLHTIWRQFSNGIEPSVVFLSAPYILLNDVCTLKFALFQLHLEFSRCCCKSIEERLVGPNRPHPIKQFGRSPNATRTDSWHG